MKRLLSLGICTVFVACSGGNGANPTASFTAPNHGSAGEALAFDAGGSTAALRYSWDFGDGGRGGGEKISHVFSSAGSYTVKLTVSGAGGKSAADSLDVTISATTPGPMTPVVGFVRDAAGMPLAGVAVSDGMLSTTSDAGGQILLTSTADLQLLSLAKSGYATQFQALDLRKATSGYFEATMQTREASQPLDAGKGGKLTAKDGAVLTLPGGALVDQSGSAVSGMIDVALTPVDVTNAATRAVFPGRFQGLAPDATQTPIMSHGVVEYALEKSGERLQLAPGRTATIEIPIYANRAATGAMLKAGDTIPLWSLDEKSGTWVEEGQGTVTASAGAPTAFTLQAEVSHFSWWNSDSPMPDPTDIGIECQCESDAEICAMFGKNAYTCHILGENDPGGGPTAAVASSPVFSSGADVVGASTVTIPANYDITLNGFAMGGKLAGSAPIRVTKGQSAMVTIPLAPKATVQALADESVTLPYIQPVTSDQPFIKHRYRVHVIGGALSAAFQAALGTTGGLRLLDSTGTQLASALFDSGAGALSSPVSAGDYVVELIFLGAGSGQITLRAGTVTDENVTVPFDATVSLAAGDAHNYHFTAAAGMLDLKWDSGGAASIGILSVTAPDGTQMFTSNHLDASFDHPFTAAAGAYTVSIEGINNVSGVLHVSSPSSASDGGVTDFATGADAAESADMTAGAMSITLPFNQVFDQSALLRLTFNAAAGSGVLFKANGGDGTTGAVRVKNSGGTLVGGFTMDAGSINAPYHPIYLADGGDYFVEIDSPVPQISYIVDVQPVTDVRAVNSRAVMPVTFSGTTATVGFTFDANAGDPILLSETGGGCTQGNAYYQSSIYEETPYSIAFLTSAAAGGLQFEAFRKTGDGCGSAYLFSVRPPILITSGTPSAPFTAGGVGDPQIQELFRFDAAKGTLFCGKVTTSTSQSSTGNPVHALTATNGTYTEMFGDDFGPVSANADGAQALTVDGWTTATADTMLWLYEVPSPPPSVADPTTPTATTLRPGEQKWFSFVSDPTNSGNWAFGKSTFTVTYQSTDSACAGSPCNGKAIVYQDPANGNRFFQATTRISSYGGSFGNTGSTSSLSATIPSSGATTWYVQLTPDTRHNAPIPSPAPHAFAASWNITASP